MRLDTQSVLAMTAVVVYVAGVLFLLEMMMRRQERVGRVWGLSFLAGMLASASYNVWALGDDSMLSAATGNGAIVASAGFMWVGCRAFNVAKQLPSAVIVTIASVGVYITTIATADQGVHAGRHARGDGPGHTHGVPVEVAGTPRRAQGAAAHRRLDDDGPAGECCYDPVPQDESEAVGVGARW